MKRNNKNKLSTFFLKACSPLNRPFVQASDSAQRGMFTDIPLNSRWLELRGRYRNIEDMIHTLFVCISGECSIACIL